MLILRKPVVENRSEQERILKDSIELMNRRLDDSKNQVKKLELANDSLLKIDQQVIYRTRDKIKFIYLDADIDDLDSIIRSISTRYR